MFDNIILSSSYEITDGLKTTADTVGPIVSFSNIRQLVACLRQGATSITIVLDAEKDFKLVGRVLNLTSQLASGHQVLVMLTKSELVQLDELLLRSEIDFIIKPIRIEELSLRIRKLHSRRFSASSSHLESIASSLSLTQKELAILKQFFCAKNRELSREQLRKLIWGETTVTSKVIDVHLFNLRKKLKAKSLHVSYNRIAKSWKLDADK